MDLKMSKGRGRAYRRFQLAKKKKSIKIQGCNCNVCSGNDKRLIGIHARTPKRCSCMLCSQSRKNYGAPLKEKSFDEVAEEIFDEYKEA
jgi:hypothetical protein